MFLFSEDHIKKKKPKKKYYQTNQYIKAETLRVVDTKAAQLGVMSTKEALKLAAEKKLDLVLVGPNAKPPVAKLINFSNFKYQQQKKEQSSNKKAKSSEIKELRITPFIAPNDLNTRLKKAREFLEDGDRVRINVKFVGRQITRKEFGHEVLENITEELKEISNVDQKPKMQGRIMTMTLKPNKN